jgi:hypothetical protein
VADEVNYWLCTATGSVLGRVLWDFDDSGTVVDFLLSASVSPTNSHSINCVTFVNHRIIGAI